MSEKKLLPMTKRQKDSKTTRQQDNKTTRQKDKDQKESWILWCQGSFALLRCFLLLSDKCRLQTILSWMELVPHPQIIWHTKNTKMMVQILLLSPALAYIHLDYCHLDWGGCLDYGHLDWKYIWSSFGLFGNPLGLFGDPLGPFGDPQIERIRKYLRTGSGPWHGCSWYHLVS